MIELPVYCINAWSWLCHKPALGYQRLRIRKHPPSNRHPALDLWECRGVTAGCRFWPFLLSFVYSKVMFPLLRPTKKHPVSPEPCRKVAEAQQLHVPPPRTRDAWAPVHRDVGPEFTACACNADRIHQHPQGPAQGLWITKAPLKQKNGKRLAFPTYPAKWQHLALDRAWCSPELLRKRGDVCQTTGWNTHILHAAWPASGPGFRQETPPTSPAKTNV